MEAHQKIPNITVHQKTFDVIREVTLEYLKYEVKSFKYKERKINTYHPQIIMEDSIYNYKRPMTLYIYQATVEKHISSREDQRFNSDPTVDGSDVCSGIIGEDYFEEVLKGNFMNESNWCVISKDVLKDRDFLHSMCFEEGFDKWDAAIAENPFDSLVKDNGILINSQLSYCGMVFDVNANPYPLGLHFEYITGHTDNMHYNIDKAYDILSKRKDIINLTKEDVPYYNAFDGSRNYLDFVWIPSKKDYTKAWNYCKKHYKEHPTTHMYEAVFNLDMLGLRKGGAALKETHY